MNNKKILHSSKKYPIPEGMKDLEDKKTESQEKMIPAIKISTVFSNEKLLEKIADKLLNTGLISGFSIDLINAGYIYHGRKIKENQFLLKILVNENIPSDKKDKIISIIQKNINQKWDVSAIEEESVLINEALLNFIKRADIEHRRFKKEKQLRLALSLTVLMTLSGIIGLVSKGYVDQRVAKTIAMERLKHYQELDDLNYKIQQKITALELQISKKIPFHYTGAEWSYDYKETSDIAETILQVREKLQNEISRESFKK